MNTENTVTPTSRLANIKRRRTIISTSLEHTISLHGFRHLPVLLKNFINFSCRKEENISYKYRREYRKSCITSHKFINS